jgi:uncharacterized protein (DUF169 family)
MDFEKESEIFKKTFGLKYEPLAITFTNDEITMGKYEKTSICKALKLAANGESFVIDEAVSTCPGGSKYCGFTEVTSRQQKRGLQKFLTKGEKLTGTIVTFERMQKLTVEPPTGLSDRILICPLGEAEMRPDMILFQCNPEQACRLIALDTYWDGLAPKQQLIGALCHTAISYTIMSGCTNLSTGDWTARHHQDFDKDIMFLSVPYERINNLISAIPHCSAGNANVKIPDEFQSD